jgi:hypothetical protein
MTGSAFSREYFSKAVVVPIIPEHSTRLRWVAYWKKGSLAKQVIDRFGEASGTPVYASPSIWQAPSCKLDATRPTPTDLDIYMVDVNHARRIHRHGCTTGEQARNERSRKRCTAPNNLDTGEGLRCGGSGLWASALTEECHRARPGQAQAAVAGACGPA